MENTYKGPERRQFLRLDYASPLAYKVCKKETVSKLMQGYTANVSQAGLLCNIKDKVKKNDLLWLSFDRNTLNICEELEKKSLIYQSGVIGKVVRLEQKKDGTYEVGVQFLTREEKVQTFIYPKSFFEGKKKREIKEEDEEQQEGLEPEEQEEQEEPEVQEEE